MTHTPPVPPGNQSPFPIQEPPHTPAAPASPSSAVPSPATSGAPSATASDEWAAPATRGWSLGRIVGAAAGVGAIAIGVAAALFPREGKPETKKKKRKN